MDTQVSDLIRLLEEEAYLHRELLSAVRGELEILRRFAVNELEESSKAKETLILKIRLMEESRRNLVAQFAEPLPGAEEPTLSIIAEDVPEPYRSRLLELRDDLLDTTQEIIDLNTRNRALITCATNSMNHLLSLIAFAGQGNPIYDQTGRTGRPNANPRFISRSV